MKWWCGSMTIIHVLNFSIPIVFIVFAGFLLDHICKPDKPAEKTEEE
jgi:hypothetical protein